MEALLCRGRLNSRAAATSILLLHFHLEAADNIATYILKLDAQVKPATPQMQLTLNEVIGDACAQIEKLQKNQAGAWDTNHVAAVFGCIDRSLIDHGFLYPDVGMVDQLADGLTPFQMTAARKPSFEAQPHNLRRRGTIEKRFPGPFYAVDCDTASFIYLGVADRLKLPIHFIDLPGREGHDGHNFVRWRDGTNSLNWETMDGCARSDDYYRVGWGITAGEIQAHSALTDLSPGQVIGYEHALLGIQFERRGDYEHALGELDQCLELYPQNLLAHNNYAWDTEVGANVKFRDHAKALTNVLYVLNLVNDPDVRDTLAAVYASTGFFNLAAAEEREVLKALPSGAYQRRLELYERHEVYRESHAPPDPDGVFKP